MTVRLTWPGKRWNAGSDASSTTRAPSLVPVERSGDGAQRMIYGDALDIARALAGDGAGAGDGLTGKVDLVYVDPPYASQADYTLEARLDGRADGRVRRSLAYEDTWNKKDGGVSAYLEMLAPRLEAMAALLSERGTLWVHVDWRASYLVRVLLDEILGPTAFKNEIVWKRAPNLGRQASSGQFGRTLDTIVVYGKSKSVLKPPTRLEPIAADAIRWNSKGNDGRPFTTAPRGDYTDASIEKLDALGRVHRTPAGKVYIKYFLQKNDKGEWCRERRIDALWTDVAPIRHAKTGERTGYPTQKPCALLERIILSATEPGALVVDLFAGSGTTGEAAHRTGRRAILGDRGAASIATTRARLLRAGAGLTLDAVSGEKLPRGKAAKLKLAVQKDGRSFVHLTSPREPLAWAIDQAAASGEAPFVCDWHGERQPGSKTIACETKAVFEHTISLSQARARIYADDGSVSDVRIGA